MSRHSEAGVGGRASPAEESRVEMTTLPAMSALTPRPRPAPTRRCRPGSPPGIPHPRAAMPRRHDSRGLGMTRARRRPPQRPGLEMTRPENPMPSCLIPGAEVFHRVLAPRESPFSSPVPEGWHLAALEAILECGGGPPPMEVLA